MKMRSSIHKTGTIKGLSLKSCVCPAFFLRPTARLSSVFMGDEFNGRRRPSLCLLTPFPRAVFPHNSPFPLGDLRGPPRSST
jgi:hypothetical protein